MRKLDTSADRSAFTLIELLVVVAIISLLASVLLPSLVSARAGARKAVCAANLRALQTANEIYQQEHEATYVPAAADFFSNRHRWFGLRDSLDEPFDPTEGPLWTYLPSRNVRICPEFTDHLTGFEAGCGGYGYNANYVGQRRNRPDYRLITDRTGNRSDLFRRSSETVAFSDSAFAAGGLIEYGFAEPPRWPTHPKRKFQPSVHFRHGGKAQVVWLDSHVSAMEMTFSEDVMGGFYGVEPAAFAIGWFGPPDNSLFDCD